jgi:hypothetical protein
MRGAAGCAQTHSTRSASMLLHDARRGGKHTCARCCCMLLGVQHGSCSGDKTSDKAYHSKASASSTCGVQQLAHANSQLRAGSNGR